MAIYIMTSYNPIVRRAIHSYVYTTLMSGERFFGPSKKHCLHLLDLNSRYCQNMWEGLCGWSPCTRYKCGGGCRLYKLIHTVLCKMVPPLDQDIIILSKSQIDALT